MAFTRQNNKGRSILLYTNDELEIYKIAELGLVNQLQLLQFPPLSS